MNFIILISCKSSLKVLSVTGWSEYCFILGTKWETADKTIFFLKFLVNWFTILVRRTVSVYVITSNMNLGASDNYFLFFTNVRCFSVPTKAVRCQRSKFIESNIIFSHSPRGYFSKYFLIAFQAAKYNMFLQWYESSDYLTVEWDELPHKRWVTAVPAVKSSLK